MNRAEKPHQWKLADKVAKKARRSHQAIDRALRHHVTNTQATAQETLPMQKKAVFKIGPKHAELIAQYKTMAEDGYETVCGDKI